MSESYPVSFDLELNISPITLSTLRRTQTLLFQTASLMRRMGLGEEINDALSRMQRAIMVANALRLAFIALNAASGPLGWALAGVGVAASVMSAGELLESEARGLS